MNDGPDEIIDRAIFGDAPPLEDMPDADLRNRVFLTGRFKEEHTRNVQIEEGKRVSRAKYLHVRAEYAKLPLPPPRTRARGQMLREFADRMGLGFEVLRNMIKQYNFEEYRISVTSDAEAVLEQVGSRARALVEGEVGYAVQRQVPRIEAAGKMMEDATKRVTEVLQAKESSGSEWDRRHREKLEEFIAEMDKPEADIEKLAKKISAYQNIIRMERLLNEKSLTGAKRQNKPRSSTRIEDPGEMASLERLLDDEEEDDGIRLIIHEDSA